jgi:hypothetical protein
MCELGMERLEEMREESLFIDLGVDKIVGFQCDKIFCFLLYTLFHLLNTYLNIIDFKLIYPLNYLTSLSSKLYIPINPLY